MKFGLDVETNDAIHIPKDMKMFVTYIERDFWERAGQVSNERPKCLEIVRREAGMGCIVVGS